jgi:hypothetical protein
MDELPTSHLLSVLRWPLAGGRPRLPPPWPPLAARTVEPSKSAIPQGLPAPTTRRRTHGGWTPATGPTAGPALVVHRPVRGHFGSSSDAPVGRIDAEAAQAGTEAATVSTWLHRHVRAATPHHRPAPHRSSVAGPSRAARSGKRARGRVVYCCQSAIAARPALPNPHGIEKPRRAASARARDRRTRRSDRCSRTPAPSAPGGRRDDPR